MGCQLGDLVLFGAGDTMTVATSLGKVRQFIGDTYNLVKASSHQHGILWITDFPMFEWNADANRYEALHHPFTAPNVKKEESSENDLRKATALAYDLVYNGVEVGGGSLRIYRSDIQRKVFDVIGMSAEEVSTKVMFLTELLVIVHLHSYRAGRVTVWFPSPYFRLWCSTTR